MVREFHERFGLDIGRRPTKPTRKLSRLRFDLLEEEFDELADAEDRRDLVEIADALGDMVYVIYGTAIAYGIDLDAVIAEIHRSNMSKLAADGTVVRREDGKVLKGPDYFKPDIAAVLGLDAREAA